MIWLILIQTNGIATAKEHIYHLVIDLVKKDRKE